MNFGIPGEISVEERRVALTPVGVYALINEGNTVFVEKGAGQRSGFSDEDYRKVGAEIVYSSEEVFQRSEIITKIMLPTEEECRFLHGNKVLLTFLNLGISQKNVLKTLSENKMTILGFEYIEQEKGFFPVLTAMSEIAGLLLPQIAGRLLECDAGGRGIMLSGVSGIPGANVVILGAGTVGTFAARAFSGLGAQVHVFDKNVDSLRNLNKSLTRVSTSIVTPLLIERAVRFADVLIGAVMVHKQKTPHIVTEAMVKEMKRGSVIIDVSIDQGGCIETSRPTTLSFSTYKQYGVTHYCVPNITSSVARTASHALNNSILPWVLQMSRLGIKESLKKYSCLKTGAFLLNGACTNETMAKIFDIKYKEMH